MLILFVTVNVKPEHRDEVLKGIHVDARGAQHDEPGCLRFDVIQDQNDQNRFYFYEVYKDQAAFDAHLKAPHFPAWRDIPKEYFSVATSVVRGHNLSPTDADYR